MDQRSKSMIASNYWKKTSGILEDVGKHKDFWNKRQEHRQKQQLTVGLPKAVTILRCKGDSPQSQEATNQSGGRKYLQTRQRIEV